MKFLALRSALEKVTKSIAINPTPFQKQIEEPPKHPHFYAYKELVAGGIHRWKPIDRQAAMLLAKANWLSQPLPTVTSTITPQTKIKHTMSSLINKHQPHPAIGINKEIETVKSDDQFNAEIAASIIAKTTKALTEADELVSKAMDARAALDVMTDYWKKDWLDFIDSGNARVRELRLLKGAMETETRQLMAQLRDVRQFLLDSNHANEFQRLKEFVEVCERLKALKDSGFLDTVADTMLKLA